MDTDQDSTVVTTHVAKLEKMVRIRLDYSSQFRTIRHIRITGDFFMHPEDSIDDLEVGLLGAELKRDALRQRISLALADTRCFGFDVESLTGAILNAGGGEP
ncbi:MAG: hypothetical protein F4Y82_04200 [Cenarchaeum sp. SB0665_bin_23]|nr:hypothetical protein [Cenarchaeum sp. SB0665_bin_23]MXZ93230.1 hypothetical protein [Cenarchaeum sp. SB0666_bin_15]MYB46561.1 hypothetical protein [Cenarchaeum sp. SB0662_bin_33]MYD58387.1 hypothetical protein [Cenarchaeum sp. SB0678_bin_8]MYG33325.1 hypothetical protein [Cenarchaeum sp. SB0677_bin_16]MYJ27783.1 hypothetical protein [Cenarchaeum sp. SB0672_bin_9]